MDLFRSSQKTASSTDGGLARWLRNAIAIANISNPLPMLDAEYIRRFLHTNENIRDPDILAIEGDREHI
ncbi:hypothetical protein AM228_24020 [Planktothricoides sp. SR001]|nr:hypothetical protein AM228_24020 [Planktothricoides sp. SR001]